MCRRSTGPGVGVNTSDPATRFSSRRTWVVGRIERALGHRSIPGRLDECPVLGVRHRMSFDREPVDGHPMGRRLLGIVHVGAHHELAAGNRDEPTTSAGASGSAIALASFVMPHPVGEAEASNTMRS